MIRIILSRSPGTFNIYLVKRNWNLQNLEDLFDWITYLIYTVNMLRLHEKVMIAPHKIAWQDLVPRRVEEPITWNRSDGVSANNTLRLALLPSSRNFHEVEWIIKTVLSIFIVMLNMDIHSDPPVYIIRQKVYKLAVKSYSALLNLSRGRHQQINKEIYRWWIWDIPSSGHQYL